MNRSEYLNELGRKMEKYPDDLIRETLHAYRSIFIDGMKKGKTDEEIIAEIGTPDEVLADIAMIHGQPQRESSSFAHTQERRTSYRRRDDSLASSIQELGEGVADLIRSTAVPIIESIRAERNARYYGRFIRLFREGVYNQLTVIADSRISIQIEAGKNAEYCFTPENHRNKADIRVASNGRELRIRAEVPGLLVLHLPNHLQRISVRTVDGDIMVRGIEAERIALLSESGDARMQSVKVISSAVTAHEGDIFLKSVTADTMTLASSGGDINFESMDAGFLHITNEYGDIDGDVYLKRLEASNGKGDVDIRLLRNFLKADIETGTGDIDLRLDNVSFRALCTSRGSITNHTFEEGLRLSDTEVRIGNGTIPVRLSSRSGDIEVTVR